MKRTKRATELNLTQLVVLADIVHWCKEGLKKDADGWQWICYSEILHDVGSLINYQTVSGIALIVKQLKEVDYIFTRLSTSKEKGKTHHLHVWFKVNDDFVNKCCTKLSILYSLIEEEKRLMSTNVDSQVEFLDV